MVVGSMEWSSIDKAIGCGLPVPGTETIKHPINTSDRLVRFGW